MRRLAFLCLLIFTGPTLAQEIPLEIKGDGVQTVKVDRVIVVKEDVLAATKFPFSFRAPSEALAFRWTIPAGVAYTLSDSEDTATITSAPGGTLAVSVVAKVVDWDAKKIVSKKFTGKILIPGGQPDPGPKPDPTPIPPQPDPGPAVQASFIIGVTAKADRTLNQAAILMDDGLKQYLASNKVGWRVMDNQDWAFKTYELDKVLADNKVEAPAIIGWFGGKIKVAEAPQSVDGVKRFVQGKSLQRTFRQADTGLDYYVSEGSTEKRFLTRLPPPAGKTFATLKMTAIPRGEWREVNRRKSFPTEWTLDQNGHGSCVGQGSVAALRRIRLSLGMTDYDLSPTCVYAQINGGSDNGAIIGDSLDALRKTGTILFSQFGQDKIYTRQLPAGWQTTAKRFRVDQAYATTSFDEMATAVMKGWPVVFGMMVGNNFESFDRYGVAGFSRGQGNHCMLFDGLVKLPDGRWVLDCQNSWGADWGPWRNGRCYLSEAHVNQADNSDAYAIKSAMEDPQETVVPPARKVAIIEEIFDGPKDLIIPKSVSVSPYERAYAKAVQERRHLLIGVDCDPPSGDWLTVRVRAPFLDWQKPRLLLLRPNGESMELVSEMSHIATAPMTRAWISGSPMAC